MGKYYAIGTLQFLLRFFHFYRCSDPTELGSYASAVKCNSCHNGYVTPMNACITNSDWDCQNCKAVLSFIDAVALDNKLIEEQQRVNRQNLDNLEKFHKTYEQFLHPSHAFLMQLKQWLFEGTMIVLNLNLLHTIYKAGRKLICLF